MSAPPPLVERASTRDALLDAATRLFAERGVFEVSLAEIVREAGQRNASAVHYHFGSRDQLLHDVLEPTVGWLRERRRALLTDALARPGDEVRPVVEVIVRPLVELARSGWRARAWMKIGTEIGAALDRAPAEIAELLRGAGGTEALALLEPRCPPMPAAVWDMRSSICIGFVSRAAADRAAALEPAEPGGAVRRPALGDERFVQNLIDMVVGALVAPVTDVR